MNLTTSVPASEDEFVLLGMILRKRRELIEVGAKIFGKEVIVPPAIEKHYRDTKELLAQWNKDKQEGRGMFYNQNQHAAFSGLAIWCLQKWHELHGTEVPQGAIDMWKVPYKALGVTSIVDTGLVLK